jgi:hypothetical protein
VQRKAPNIALGKPCGNVREVRFLGNIGPTLQCTILALRVMSVSCACNRHPGSRPERRFILAGRGC